MIRAWQEVQSYIETLEKENKRLNELLNSDERLNTLEAENRELRRQLVLKNDFILQDEEVAAIERWKKENNLHDVGACSGSFTYSFIPTSIGTIGEIEHASREKFCFRDL